MKALRDSSLGKDTQKWSGQHKLYQKLKSVYTAYNKSSKRLRQPKLRPSDLLNRPKNRRSLLMPQLRPLRAES